MSVPQEHEELVPVIGLVYILLLLLYYYQNTDLYKKVLITIIYYTYMYPPVHEKCSKHFTCNINMQQHILIII